MGIELLWPTHWTRDLPVKWVNLVNSFLVHKILKNAIFSVHKILRKILRNTKFTETAFYIILKCVLHLQNKWSDYSNFLIFLSCYLSIIRTNFHKSLCASSLSIGMLNYTKLILWGVSLSDYLSLLRHWVTTYMFCSVL